MTAVTGGAVNRSSSHRAFRPTTNIDDEQDASNWFENAFRRAPGLSRALSLLKIVCLLQRDRAKQAREPVESCPGGGSP